MLFLFTVFVCGAVDWLLLWRPSSLLSSLFPTLTAAATVDVTNSVLKDYLRGRIECVVTLIFSQRDWMGSHEAVEAIKLITFDLQLSSLCPCGSVGCVEWADCMGDPQLSALRLSIPFLNTETKHTHTHTRCSHANKGTHGCLHTNTCTQTGKFHSRRQTDLHLALSVFWFEL